MTSPNTYTYSYRRKEKESKRSCLCWMSRSVCGVEDSKSPIQCYVSDDSGPLPGLYKYTRLLFTSVTSIRRARASGLQADCVSEFWRLHKMFYEHQIFKFILYFSVLLGFIAFHLPQNIVNNEKSILKVTRKRCAWLLTVRCFVANGADLI